MALEIIEAKMLRPFKYPRIVHEGFLYHFHKKCNHHIRWKCGRVNSSKCRCVLRTSMDFVDPKFIAVDHQHNHEEDLVSIAKLRLKISIHQQFLQKNAMFKPNNNSDISTIYHKPSLRCIEDQNSITISSNLKNNHQKQIETVNDIGNKSSEINNAENVIAENNTSCFTLNDKINVPNQRRKESLLREQIMMDTKCNTIEVSKKEKNKDIKKKVSTSLTRKSPADLNSSKLYQVQSVNSKNDLTEFDPDVKAAQSKKMKMIIESSENTRSVQKTSKISPKSLDTNNLIAKLETLKSKKINLTQSGTCVKTKSKKYNMNKSSTPLFIGLCENESSDITTSRISQELVNTNLNNATQSDSVVKLTQTKCLNSNKPSTSEIVDITGDSTLAMATLRLSSNLLNSQQSILTQHDTEINKSNQVENNELSVPMCIDLNVECPPAKPASRIRYKKTLFTQLNKNIAKIPSTSVSTCLSRSIPKSFKKKANCSGHLVLNNVITRSIDNNSKKLTNQAKNLTLSEEVILPTVVRRYDKTTKQYTYLFPTSNKKLENNSHKPNLVDIGNITYKPKFSNQTIPTIPDVLDEGSPVTNINDCTMISRPIHSDNSLSQSSDSVPQAIPLLPSIIANVDLNQMGVQEPIDNDILTMFNETNSLTRPELSIQTNHATSEQSIILSWTLSTNSPNSQVDTIKAYEIFSCEPSLETNNYKHNTWEQIGLVNAEPGIMACALTGFGLKGKTYFYAIRAKNVQDVNGPFSHPVFFKCL